MLENFQAADLTIETQLLVTIIAPFIVFGAIFVVLLLLWD